MATPAEQLKTIQQNLALAKANGDTQKVAALEKSQESVQALVDINNGTFNTPVSNTTTGAVQDATGGFTETSPDGTVSKYNSQGIMYSMTEPNGTVTRAPNVVADPETPVQTANQVAAEQKPVSVAESLGPKEEIVQPEKTVGTEDPMAAALAANQASNEEASPTEQQVLAASSDAKLSQAEQKQLDEAQESQRAKLKAEESRAGNPEGNWTAGSVDQTRTQQAVFVARNSILKDDWRIRLSLAPSSNYLYKSAKIGDVLYPLLATDGIVFPYTPSIQTAYRANYDAMDLTHSNYKLHFYKNSNVDEIQITADFTAQDTTEANYLLGVIHFFKSVTKMFYGQDGNNGPKAGTPPPLCYLNGYGQYQFNEHPVLVSSFTYNLPNDVDYIRAGAPTVQPGTNTNSFKSKPKGFSFSDLFSLSKLRAQGSRLKQNSMSAEPAWKNYSNENATYVPTKIQIQLSLIPVVTRNDISKNFSLEKYATGELLKGRTRSGGGIW